MNPILSDSEEDEKIADFMTKNRDSVRSVASKRASNPKSDQGSPGPQEQEFEFI